MRTQIIISSKTVEKLKQNARRLKKEDGISHHEALDQVAKKVGFDHWHHVSESAKAFAPTEQAYYFGTIIAMDVKDGMDFHDPSGAFVEDNLAPALCTDDIYEFVRTAEAEDGEIDTSDPTYQEDLKEWASDISMNYTFFRYTGAEIPANVEDVVKLTSKCCFWPPEFIWHKGAFQESPSDVALDDDGEVAGVRFG
ncbi:MAG: hypothetical protein FHK80_08650 [Azoarcus sp. PHD]|nr:MAG: hypothetical protein FHK80_08650 [Azoarcus sp. PHD]